MDQLPFRIVDAIPVGVSTLLVFKTLDILIPQPNATAREIDDHTPHNLVRVRQDVVYVDAEMNARVHAHAKHSIRNETIREAMTSS
jgi:hypothetical protein